jgi:DNA-directed RNA polymerase specialized sigma24 family protein
VDERDWQRLYEILSGLRPRFVPRREQADLAQETLVRVVRHGVESIDTARALATKIYRDLCVDWQRRERRGAVTSARAAARWRPLTRAELDRCAMLRLGGRQRELVDLLAHGLPASLRGAARTLQCDPKDVRAMLKVLRRKLADEPTANPRGTVKTGQSGTPEKRPVVSG